MAAGNRLRELRDHAGFTLRELETALAESGHPISHEALSKIERGLRKKPNRDLLKALAALYGWSSYTAMMASTEVEPTPALRLAKGSRQSVDNALRGPLNGSVVRVPSALGRHATAWREPSRNPPLARLLITQFMGVKMLSVHPQAAVSADALVTGDHLEVDGSVAIHESMADGRTLQAVRVTGSCMEPEISAGDVVIIEMDRVPVDGEVVVVEYEGRTLVKRWWDDGETVFLQANRAADSLPAVPKDDLVVLGVVIGGVYEVLKQQPRWRRTA